MKFGKKRERENKRKKKEHFSLAKNEAKQNKLKEEKEKIKKPY